MKRIVSFTLALAFVAALGTSATAQPNPVSTKGPNAKCPQGQKWVKPYTNSSGVKVAGSCQESKKAKKQAKKQAKQQAPQPQPMGAAPANT
jgi:hypothetical protein